MFQIHPFAAFRPLAAKSAEISCEPGMRLSLTEAAQKVEAFPNSWLQVVRADVREKLNAPDAGTRLFERMKNEKWICQDAQPHMYAYRQSRAGKKFVSLIAAMEISPTVFSALLRFQKSDAAVMHQTWLRDKELTAHAEIPVLAFHPNEELSDVIQSATNERPLAHFVGKDGATHTVWACKETERVAQLVGQLNSLVILSGDEMFARASHLSNSASVLRAVALTAIERVSIRASRILVSGGDANLLEIKLGQFQDANVRETPENVGDPPPGFFDAYMFNTQSTQNDGATATGSWKRRRLPPMKAGHSVAANWDRTRFERIVVEPWKSAHEFTEKIQIHSMNSVVSLGQLTQFVDSGQAQAVFVFPIPSMDDLLEIAQGNESIPHHAITFSPAIPSGLFIQSIV